MLEPGSGNMQRGVEVAAEVEPVEAMQENEPEALANVPHAAFVQLRRNLCGYLSSPDLELVTRAYHFAARSHAGQRRASGEPYITHPLEVANILTMMKMDMASIAAAVLHDVVEDTDTTLDDIQAAFGDDVAQLVDSLTKISRIKFRSKQERLAENFRKMVVAMAKDLRVILIKLADRLHNMRTISVLPPAKRMRIARETLDIYAPLATRLGIYGIKSELEDLCFRQVKNDVYSEIAAKVAQKKAERERYIDEVRGIIAAELERYGFKASVYGRPKHFYSIYKKMVDRKLNFEEIHDLFAFRIIVDSIKDCYEALGIIHAMWKPMPGRFKDYIAMPKANLYQSLHTTVIRSGGEPAEIQIRTVDMHERSEYGIAAHAFYKESIGKGSKAGKTDTKAFSWLRQMMQWQSELTDPEEFLEAVKVELFEEEIFVFTPQGDVIQLPLGGTAIDFAFSVHTDVGLHCAGAKVNGKMVSIKQEIKSGDIVEILTSPHQRPNKEWLNCVRTSKARNRIRAFLRSEKRQRSRVMGEELLRGELSLRRINYGNFLTDAEKDQLTRLGKESNFDDLLISIGYGKVSVENLLNKRFKGDKDEVATSQGRSKTAKVISQKGVLISGLDDILVSFGRCCSPLPGEEIVGFITRGRGVTVHSKACSRVFDMDPQRRIVADWKGGDGNGDDHPCYLRVTSKDRKGILAEVTNVIATHGANILEANIRTTQGLTAVHDFRLGLNSMRQLQAIISKLEMINSVVSVERRAPTSPRQRRRNRV